MGVIHFHVARPDLLTAGSDLSLVDFLMYDGRVVPARVSLQGNILRCSRNQTESGQMRIPWPRFDGSIQVVHTTSLREQTEPYDLEVELARGQLARLRTQHQNWTGAGLQVSSEVEQLISEAHRAFRAAVLKTEAPEVSAAAALLSMDLSARATDLLCQHYTEQRLSFRRSRTTHLPVFLGCQLDQVPAEPTAFCSAFNAVLVGTSWARLESRDGEYNWTQIDQLVDWAVDNRLAIMGGPLLELSVNLMPPWMQTWSGDLVNLQSFTADFVETVVGRYLGRIRHWEVVSGANCGGVGELNEEQRMHLVARAVDAARQVDEHVDVSLRVVQPWGEYLSQSRSRLAPIQFIDTLRRCGVHFSQVNLEISVSPRPNRTLLRDPLSLSQLLDQWTLLQMPVNVLLSAPSALVESAVAEPESCSARWFRDTLAMCLSKERIVGVYCLNWHDPVGHLAAPGKPRETGLIRPGGAVGQSLETLTTLRQLYWSS